MNEAKNRTLTINRTFDAAISLVWEAWTKPEHISKWWSPKGMEVNVIKHEFKEGGSWKYAMEMPDGSEFISDGVYIEIVENQKIVTSANFKPMTEGVELYILFEAQGNKTKFTFSVVHPTEEYSKQQKQMGFYNGWGSTFERMEELLSDL